MERQYKDSGIEWIGRMPKEWKTCQLKRCLSFQNGQDYKAFEVKEGKGFPVYGSGGVFAYTDRYMHDGESVLFGRKGTIDRPLYVNCKFWTVDTMYYTVPRKEANCKFLYYVSTTIPYAKYSTSTALPSMTQTVLGNMIIPVPPLPEQRRIADYLDKKCGEIDGLVSLQEQMIQTLTDYKQSVITEAVTKGLNPNAHFVPSGIDWIGDVPEGWKIVAIKYIMQMYAGATPKSDNEKLWDGDIPWITPADYKTEDVYVAGGRRNISEAGLHSCATTVLPVNSIIFSKRAPIGLVAINKVPLCTNQGCIGCVSRDNKAFFKFYYYALSAFTEQFELFGSGTTFKEISANNFANFPIVLPPLPEQHAIASFLDTKCSEIDSLIALKQKKIAMLKDYKKSVIYEAVTGKATIEQDEIQA